MSEINFGIQAGSAPAPIIDADTGQSLPAADHAAAEAAAPAAAPAAETAVAVRRSSLPDFKNVILPHLNIVHPLSKTAVAFPVGSVIFADKTLLFSPPVIDKDTGNVTRVALPPVSFTVIDFKPERFVEKVANGIGLMVDSESKVVSSGGTLDYTEWNLKKASGMKLFQVLAEALIAIERPEHIADDDTVFVYKVGDKKYTLAIWSMKGSVYTEAAKRVLFYHRTSGCLINGYPAFSFSLTTKFKPFKTGNSSWVPVVTARTKSTPEFLDFAARLGNQS